MIHNHLVNIGTLERKREIKNYKAPTLRKREINNYKEPALRLEAIFTLMLNWSTTSAIFLAQHKGGLVWPLNIIIPPPPPPPPVSTLWLRAE